MAFCDLPCRLSSPSLDTRSLKLIGGVTSPPLPSPLSLVLCPLEVGVDWSLGALGGVTSGGWVWSCPCHQKDPLGARRSVLVDGGACRNRWIYLKTMDSVDKLFRELVISC